jgi:hypothetical protein
MPTGFNPIDLPGQIVDEGWSGRITDPETGAGLFNSNTNPGIVGIDPITGEEAPLGTDVGFGASVRRWLQAGIYNSDFSLPANSLQQPIDDEYNPLPYWSWGQSEAGAVKATVANDDTLASGRKLRFSMTAFGSTSDDGYVAQVLPVPGSKGEDFSFDVSATFVSTGSTATEAPLAKAYLDVQYLDAARGAVSSALRVSEHFGNIALTRSLSFGSTNDIRIPEGAYYALVKVGVERATEPTTSSGTVDLTDTWAIYTPIERQVTDTIMPSADGAGAVGTATNSYAAGYIDALSSNGIKFPATQVSSADPNTLDDYQEGSWSPSYDAGFTVFSYAHRLGRYQKVGRKVTLWFYLEGATAAVGSGSSIVVGGLPFNSVTGMIWTGVLGVWAGFWPSGGTATNAACLIQHDNSYIDLRIDYGANSFVPETVMGATYLSGCISYETSA